MQEFLSGIWGNKTLIVAIIVIAILITVWGIIKRHALIILICLFIFGSGSTMLVTAWNSLNSAASTVLSGAEEIATEQGIYDKEKAEDFGSKVKNFFTDLFN